MMALLKLLEDGTAWTPERLAEKLGVSDDEVKRQMEFLEHAGYLRRVNEENSGGCAGCSGCSGHCGEAGVTKAALSGEGSPIFWEVIEKKES